MKDINGYAAKCWCDRLAKLMKENGYTQMSFLKEYRAKYGGGTQANISRWLRVGNKDGNGKTIGFPTYDTMLNLSDFFDVSVGYLTGETNYHTFEMEKVCEFMKLDEDTIGAIKYFTSGKMGSRSFDKKSDECTALFKHLLIAKSFKSFFTELQEYVETYYDYNHTVHYMDQALKEIPEKIRSLALQCIDYSYNCGKGIIDDFSDNNVEVTEELLNAISSLKVARDKGYEEFIGCERNIKLSEYELNKIYFEIIKELVTEKNLSDIVISSRDK